MYTISPKAASSPELICLNPFLPVEKGVDETFTINRPDYELMLAHLLSVYPQEGCGFLAGTGEQVSAVYPVENILRSPLAYEMDPRQQIETMLAVEAAGMEIAAIFHSHPHGPDMPSETDMAGAYYPEVRQIIVSLADPRKPVARAYWITMKRFRHIQLRIL